MNGNGIRLENLDEAHSQATKLYNTGSKNGVEILNQLETLINNLKNHWIGEDGTKHINRLIEIHDKLQGFLSVTLENTRDAVSKIVQVQEVRRANGGSGVVGEVVAQVTDFVKSIEKAETTAEYFIDPAINEDYSFLEGIEEKFKSFDNDFKNEKNDLMQNWKSGNNREQIQAQFDQIESLGQEAEKVLAEVKQELSTSINNARQIM